MLYFRSAGHAANRPHPLVPHPGPHALDYAATHPLPPPVVACRYNALLMAQEAVIGCLQDGAAFEATADAGVKARVSVSFLASKGEASAHVALVKSSKDLCHINLVAPSKVSLGIEPRCLAKLPKTETEK